MINLLLTAALMLPMPQQYCGPNPYTATLTGGISAPVIVCPTGFYPDAGCFAACNAAYTTTVTNAVQLAEILWDADCAIFQDDIEALLLEYDIWIYFCGYTHPDQTSPGYIECVYQADLKYTIESGKIYEKRNRNFGTTAAYVAQQTQAAKDAFDDCMVTGPCCLPFMPVPDLPLDIALIGMEF